MLELNPAVRIEANQVNNENAWLILLEIQIEELEPIRVVRNNEPIEWGGFTWEAFPFEMDDIKETKTGEVPSVVLRVSNVTRALQGYIDYTNGGVGGDVILRVVHSAHLYLTEPELEEYFTCISTKCDNNWIYFELGIGEPIIKRFPPNRFIKNFCRFKFKSIECGVHVSNPATSCKRNLTACREFNNSARFGGFMSIPQGGIYV